MKLANTTAKFGAVSRGLHWLMALGIIGMLGFGTYLANMTVNLSNFHLYGWHKSIGIVLLALAALRLGWHLASPPPGSLPASAWQQTLVRWVHRAFYVLMFAVPLTGWIGSAATGIDVQLFGLTLPRIAPVSETWETVFLGAHGWITKALAVLILIHVAGALKRRDGTLRRMLRG